MHTAPPHFSLLPAGVFQCRFSLLRFHLHPASKANPSHLPSQSRISRIDGSRFFIVLSSHGRPCHCFFLAASIYVLTDFPCPHPFCQLQTFSALPTTLANRHQRAACLHMLTFTQFSTSSTYIHTHTYSVRIHPISKRSGFPEDLETDRPRAHDVLSLPVSYVHGYPFATESTCKRRQIRQPPDALVAPRYSILGSQ